jgi:hypothetical protein
MFKKASIPSILLCILALLVCTSSRTAGYDYRMHCLYVYKFSQLTQWQVQKSNTDLVIGIAGITPLVPELEQYIKSKNNTLASKIKVIRFASAAIASQCDVLYITKEQIKNTDTYLQKFKNKPVLIITEVPGLIKKGACINLIYEEGSSIKIQMNKTAFANQQIKITPELAKLANEIIE